MLVSGGNLEELMRKESDLSRYKIKNKLILLLIMPILFVAASSVYVVLDALNEYKNLETTKEKITKTAALSDVVQYLQIERGLMVGLVSSHKTEDEKIRLNRESLKNAATKAKTLYQNDKNQQAIMEICEMILSNSQDEMIKDFAPKEVRDFYTSKINTLLNFASTIPSKVNDKETRNLIQSYIYLAESKEALGVIRASMNDVLISQKLNTNNLLNITESYRRFEANENNILNTFEEKECKMVEKFKDYTKTNELQKMLLISRQASTQSKIPNMPSNVWFEEATIAINGLKNVETFLFDKIENLIKSHQDLLNNKIFAILIFLIFAIITFLIAIFFIYRRIIQLSNELLNKTKLFSKLARTDTLTGLLNRYSLNQDVAKLSNISIAIINIDNFKQTNDFYGYKFGDEVIKYIAAKADGFLKNIKNSRYYRMQGDEFVLLGYGYTKDDFLIIVDDIIALLKEKIEIDGKEVYLTFRCGVSFEKPKDILSTANMAALRAKIDNKRVVVYSESISMNSIYQNNIKWTNQLSNAFKNSKIVAYYQPIVNNETKTIEKYESLVRMIDTDGNIVSPFFFLDIAKQTKQYLDITKIVVDQACKKFKENQFSFSINLTMKDIQDREIVDYIFDKITEYKVNNRVIFEIVESEYVENLQDAILFINRAKQIGAKVAIDDFGTGYSNFEYLTKLNVDILKIDGSLIKDIAVDNNKFLVVATIVEFARKMNLKIVAEFVEDEATYKAVKKLSIDYSQGYFFGKPEADI